MRLLFLIACLAAAAAFAPELGDAPKLGATGSLALAILGLGALRNAG